MNTIAAFVRSVRFISALCLWALVALCLLPCGCASVYMTQRTNQEVLLQRTIRLQAQGNQIQAGFDLMDVLDSGYLASWKAHPWLMTGATVADVGTGIAAYSIYQSNKSEPVTPQIPTIQAANGDVYVLQGDGNTISRQTEVTK